jgi:hypothetical protein
MRWIGDQAAGAAAAAATGDDDSQYGYRDDQVMQTKT